QVAAGAQVWLDPMPCAGLLAALRAAGVSLHLLEAVDVAAASYEFKAEVRARRVTADDHPALREAMMHAQRRPLATAFAFARRPVPLLPGPAPGKAVVAGWPRTPSRLACTAPGPVCGMHRRCMPGAPPCRTTRPGTGR